MHELRKSFRGYRVSDVEERIRELETRLEASAARCVALEKQAEEARRAAKSAADELSSKNAELEKLARAYEAMCQGGSRKKNEAETIGYLYIKAFESGREIARSPQPHVERYLAGIGEVTEKARRDIAEAGQDFADASGRAAGLAAEIGRQAEALRQRIQALAASVSGIGDAYDGFDKVRKATASDMERIQKRYEQMVSGHFEPAAVSPAVKLKNVSLRTAEKETENGREREIYGETVRETEGRPERETGRGMERETERETESKTEKNADLPFSTLAVPDAQPEKIRKDEGKPIAAEAPLPRSRKEVTQGSVGEATPAVFDAGKEEADTAADFLDASDTSVQESPAAASGNTADKAVAGQTLRGQNIMHLLSKYQKR